MVLIIGPVSAPITGQTIATIRFVEYLKGEGIETIVFDTSVSDGKLISKLKNQLQALITAFRHKGSTYISANSDKGFFLSLIAGLFVLLKGRRLVIHYHTYKHFRKRNALLNIFAKITPNRVLHVLLCDRMERDCNLLYGLDVNTIVLNNTYLIEDIYHIRSMSKCVPLKKSIIYGHLSNLCEEKGTGLYLNAAMRDSASRNGNRYFLAGPYLDDDYQKSAESKYVDDNSNIKYLGPLYGEDKFRFYQSIDVLVFPTMYANEAQPLILFEAMSQGVLCIATGKSCIIDDLRGVGIVIPEEYLNDESVLSAMKEAKSKIDKESVMVSQRCRERFESMLESSKHSMSLIGDYLR